MISVVIKDDGEQNVIKLTYENMWKELKDIPDTELLVSKNWFDELPKIKNKYVCFVESDCMVNSGYFSSQIGLLKKNPMFRKIAVLSSSTAVKDWHNKFYGYSLGNNYADGVIPQKDKKSRGVYPVQIGYIPGAIIRMTMLRRLLENFECSDNLVKLSTDMSLGFWAQGDGNRVHINPNATYVTTETYVNDIGKFDSKAPAGLISMFNKESI